MEISPLSPKDSLGRGLKGHAHGSIVHKTITRQRKSGKVATYQQTWYQWQDKTGKHSRYLNRKQATEGQRLLDEGALIADILDFLCISVNQ